MLRSFDELSHHRLDHANVAIQDAAHNSSEQGDPVVGGEADNEEGQHCACAAEQKHRFAADAIGEGAPEHARQGLGKGEGGDQDSSVERGVIGVADMELADHHPRIREDGSESNWLGHATYGCGGVSMTTSAHERLDEMGGSYTQEKKLRSREGIVARTGSSLTR